MTIESSQPNEEFLRRSFAQEQALLVTSLKFARESIQHHQGDKGEACERYFIKFLRQYLPKRYTVEKASVLDSNGNVSESMDIVVFDRQYTPTLLDAAKHRYVPAEAVYAVFECKQTIDKANLEYAAKKAASVRRLKRTSVPIHHAGGTFPAKTLFPIVSGILAYDVGWKDGFGDSFRSTHQTFSEDRLLDCGFAASGASFDTFAGPGAYTYGPSENALAYFAFRLLWKLQSLATVPAVDWMAYAQRLANLDPGASESGQKKS